MAAMCVGILSLASLLDVLDVSLAVLAGLVVCVCSVEFGDKFAWAVYLVAGLLSLLLPQKGAGVFFLLFGGWYPIMQKKFLSLKPALSWMLRLFVFNLILFLFLFISAKLLGGEALGWIYLPLIVLANFCFVLYDILLGRVIVYYIVRLRGRLRFK